MTYITAIEISSSKISGTVGIETYNGIKILAAASTPVKGYISKGVVRNVDETSNAINYIINTLESSLDKVEIKRAYISLAGLTMKSIKSTVTRTFDTFTKITPEIINELALENDKTFQTPEGYTRVEVVNQGYKLDGKTDNNPVGAPTMQIEGNYLNIVIKEQFLRQLNESFAQAEVEITDSFCAARMDSDILLTNDARRNGCALVNIGADTTTITIYNKDILRKLVVIPLGSRNITMDLCAGQLSFDEAEEIKIARGYKSPNNEKEPIDCEMSDSIINARMGEILQNVKYQIEESGELVNQVIFTGGGSKLKNLMLLLDEFLPNFTNSIVSEPRFTIDCSSDVNINGIFSTALYGLLSQGKENCCDDIKPVTAGTAFTGQLDFKEEEEETIEEEEIIETPDPEEEARLEKERKQREKEEERLRKEEEKRIKKEKKEREKREKGPGLFDTLFGRIKQGTKTLVGEITSDDGEDYNDDDDN